MRKLFRYGNMAIDSSIEVMIRGLHRSIREERKTTPTEVVNAPIVSVEINALLSEIDSIIPRSYPRTRSYPQTRSYNIPQTERISPKDCLRVRKLKTKEFDDIQCNVCLENYEMGSDIAFTPCGHCFHESCITQWLSRGTSFTCPLCRKAPSFDFLPESDIHMLNKIDNPKPEPEPEPVIKKSRYAHKCNPKIFTISKLVKIMNRSSRGKFKYRYRYRYRYR